MTDDTSKPTTSPSSGPLDHVHAGHSIETFLPAAATAPDEIALRWRDRTMTWAELERDTRRYANAIEALGVAPGDRVAVMSLNRPEWIIALTGNLLAGALHVPVNWHLAVPEVAYVLQDSNARVLIVDDEHHETGRAAADEAGVEHVVLTSEFDQWLGGVSDEHPVAGTPGGSVMVYTSGTTGKQKGVLRAGMERSVEQVMAGYGDVARAWLMPESGVHLMACPLYHSTPQGMAMFCASMGHPMVLMEGFDPLEFLHLVEQYAITESHLVPTQFIRLLRLDDEQRTSHDMSTLRAIWHGAAPCPPWAKHDMIAWLGPIVIEYFGSSEGTGPLIATSTAWLERPGTCGRATDLVSVTVVDDEGNDLPPGKVGTLYFRRSEGPPTYHSAPEKTAAMRLSDGRFTVGDVGWMDEEGYVFLADRKVDMIISGGANIYPSEIESIISHHPDVSDCAVFGIPDDEWGEQVKAAVEVRPGHELTEGDLLEWCRGRMAGFKTPRSIDFHDHLPREASGKMKKRILRDPYWVHALRPI